MNTYGVAKLTILVVVVVMLYAVITIMTGCNPQSETDAFDEGYVITEDHAQGVILEVGHDVIVVDLEYDGVYEESEGRMKWIPTEGSQAKLILRYSGGEAAGIERGDLIGIGYHEEVKDGRITSVADELYHVGM